MLAKHLSIAEIYTTARSQEKRDFLQRKYRIPAECIFNSRDTSFASAVLAATKGRGVQVMLNSLPSPLLQASLSILAPLGYLVKIGKKDIKNNSLVALEAFSRGISFVSLDIPSLLRHHRPVMHCVLGEISRLIKQQDVKPVHPITIYRMQDAQDAFRFMQTGGISGIRRSITHWLVAHSAKNLILLSRSAGDFDLEKNKDSSGALFVHKLRKIGYQVKPISCNIALPSSLTMALRACKDNGFLPVHGIIQGAMLLRDAIFKQMTLDDWHSGLQPKLYGTWNLHTEFSQRDSLDFFIMLSSVSGVVGIASQTNYAASGSYEDTMARWRQFQGLPGVSIDLGPISDIGYVSTSSKVTERLRKDGDFSMLNKDIVLRALNATVLHPLGARSQIIVSLNSSPGPQWDVNGRLQLGRDARFAPLQPRNKTSAPSGDSQSTSDSLSLQLAKASDRQEGAGLIGAAIASRLANIFMAPVGEIDLSKPPAHFGVDSLITVELRNMLVLQAMADISIFNILQIASFAALAGLVAEKSKYLQDV
ncbi:acyl transferase acyl hydrolase lysophospholipase [Fusarium phyllophilum]|uniref:Acyl transferase acyl hydrolase lysophospholipase n=1 Tax=Fusarium phyllophilum TaxID=47803 RepID=A0A8H5NKM6_9HYPO|nr:acyl transferase acyl hydrolase lysophospholipase [Fusarium phyllophilum]